MFRTYRQAIFVCAGLIVIAVLAWVIAAFSLQSNPEQEKAQEKIENFVAVPDNVASDLEIRDARIEKRIVPLTLRITGQIKPEVGKEVDVNTRFSGRVIKLEVALGQTVHAGDVLATIDSREIGDLQAELIEGKSKVEISKAHEHRESQVYQEQLERPSALIQAKSEYSQAKSHLDLTESEYKRQEQLHQEKIASTKDFLRSKEGYETAKADFVEKQQNLQREERLFNNRAIMRRDLDLARAESKRAQQHLNTLVQRLVFLGMPKPMVEEIVRTGRIQVFVPLRSPAEGVVTHIDASVGEVVSPEKIAFRVTNLSSVVVAADLPEIDLARVRMGSPATVKVASYPKEKFHGTIDYISQHVDEETRTVAIRVRLPNDDNRLKSNMFAEIDIEEEAVEMLACPTSAIQEREGKKVVYVHLDKGYQEREIRTGKESEDYVEVVSGLMPGDKVATQGSLMLKTDLTYRH